MFVQVIQGKVSDPVAFADRGRVWADELAPGAIGFLGSTGGVTADGTAILVARFSDEGSAQANAARPEQDAWWHDTKGIFDGPVTFRETSDVELYRDGGTDQAGFVQIMQGSVKDRARYSELMAMGEQEMAERRPDVLGGMTSWFGNDYVEAIYFSSEAEAREGERNTSQPDQMPAEMREWLDLADGDIMYLDLAEPVFQSKA